MDRIVYVKETKVKVSLSMPWRNRGGEG